MIRETGSKGGKEVGTLAVKAYGDVVWFLDRIEWSDREQSLQSRWVEIWEGFSTSSI